jgi:hypothetical protein
LEKKKQKRNGSVHLLQDLLSLKAKKKKKGNQLLKEVTLSTSFQGIHLATEWNT